MAQNNDPDLWMVMAIIQDFRLDTVTLALEQLAGFAGMTVSDCRGFGSEKLRDGTEPSESREPTKRSLGVVDFTTKVKLEIAVAGRETAERVEEAIVRAAHTGRRGDGKVFSWPLAHAVRIRTMEVGRTAIES